MTSIFKTKLFQPQCLHLRRGLSGGLFLMLAAVSTNAQAQGDLSSKGSYEYQDAQEVWRNTGNAAGLGLDSLTDRGLTYFELSQTNSDHHLVQDGDKKNTFHFLSERYQRVSRHIVGFGRFEFNTGRDFNRAWCDVLRNEHSNPYISGSAIPGKYERQFIDLTARLSTIHTGPFTYGFRLDYKVGDYSRLKDPRSRVMMARYRVAPAITYTLGQHSVGLAPHYQRYKEKLTGLTTVQSDATLMYYQATGLEHVIGTVGGYNAYSREYVNHEFGLEFEYSFRTEAFQSLNAFGFEHAREYMYEQYKAEPAAWRNQEWRFQSQNRIHGNTTLHQLDLTLKYKPALGDEHRQQKVIELNSETGASTTYYQTLITYKNRYEQYEYLADMHYKLLWLDGDKAKAYAGARAIYQYDKAQYNLPVSTREVGGLDALLEGGGALFHKGDKSLWVEATAGYHFSTLSDLNLNDATGIYATSVLLPDMDYYGANYYKGQLELTYQMPITFKTYRNIWFIKFGGSYLKTDNETDGYLVTAALGIYY